MASVRKSIPLTERDLSDLARIRDGGSPVEAALEELLGELPGTSEAAYLSAVFRAGLRAIDQQMLADGYAALAVSYETDPEERAYREAMARRAGRFLADAE